MDAMSRTAVPVLVRVAVCAALTEPMAVLGKVRTAGVKVAVVGVAALPTSEAVNGPAEVAAVRVPVREPAATGEKTMETVQDEAGATTGTAGVGLGPVRGIRPRHCP